ncbi:MAG: nitrilase-related carbon-nitrogen hydrolase, partial [Pseudomonadota bacterium]
MSGEHSLDFSTLGYLRVAAVAPVVEIGQPLANLQHIRSCLAPLATQQVSVAVFPELCLSGYSAEDLFFTEPLLRGCVEALHALCADNPLPLLLVGCPWQLADGRLLNCAVAISGGRVLGMVPKSVQPNYGEFYDLRWFVPGANINEVIQHPDLGQFALRVDQLFELGGTRLGIEICEDLWAPQPPGVQAALAGADIVANLSASNELIAKVDYRRDLVRMASAKNICGYVYAGASATESSKDVVYGGHCMIYESGQQLAESDRFSLQGTQIVADLDIHRLRHDRAQNISFASSPRPTPYRCQT